MSRATSLAQHLRSLKAEREEISERKAIYDHDANRAVNALLKFSHIVRKASEPDSRRSTPSSAQPPAQPAEETPPIPDLQGEESDDATVPKWAKKVFRLIALKTHPDKVNNDPTVTDTQRDHLVNLYREASAAFKEGRFESLAEIAAELEIPVEIPVHEMETALERKIVSLKNEIAGMQRTLSWVWGASFGDVPVRVKVLVQMIKILGISALEEKILTDIVRELESQPDFDVVDRLGQVRRIKSGADRRKVGMRPEKRIK